MSKIQVTVELDFPKLDDTASRELAKQLLENRGFNVMRTAIAKATDGGKPFIPKAGKPGSVVVRGGRKFEVWDQAAPNLVGRDGLWVVPVDRTPEDADVYLTSGSGGTRVEPYHGNGQACRPTFVTKADYTREEIPCQHPSHRKAGAA